MAIHMTNLAGGLAVALALLIQPARAADYPAPQQADWIAHDFRFHDGTVFPELREHYVTIGNPAGQPVLILHGTAGSGMGMVTPDFAGALFGPGQPLDAAKYFIILPDAIGAGGSSKPSDGLKAKFPEYDYEDMVNAQYRLVTEGLGIKHLRLVIGNSMGGMHTWMWGTKYPGFADVLVPMASQPTETAARNWMMRRMIIDMIKADPDWDGGNYKTQPKALRLISVFFNIATNGGTLAYQSLAPTHAAADKLVDAREAAAPPADANDFLYQWNASRDYNPSPDLERITATLLAINSADDERNPPETGIEERELRRVAHGSLYLIPASSETRGHGTTAMAKFYQDKLASVLASAPVLKP